MVLWANFYGCLDEVVMFLMFKRVFRSGHFHSKKVPQSLNVSRPTFNKYLKVFIASGWAQRYQGGFRLIGIRELQKMVYQVDRKYCFSKIITLKNTNNKSNLRSQLRWIVLQHKAKQQQFSRTCENFSIPYSEQRRLPKALKKKIMAGITQVEMSCYHMGKYLFRSKSTGYREKDNLYDLNMLRATAQESLVVETNVSAEEWMIFRSKNMGSFWFSQMDGYHNGIIFEWRPDRIKLKNPAQKEIPYKVLNNIVPPFLHTRKLN